MKKNQFLQQSSESLTTEEIKKITENIPLKNEPQWSGPVKEIIIKTDGNSIFVEKDDNIGGLEFEMILTKILKRLIQ